MKSATLIALDDFRIDPRSDMDAASLEAANRNAFPIVAGHVQRRDGLGLLAGAAIALVLGTVTFLSLSSHHAPQSKAAPLPVMLAPAHVEALTAKPVALPVRVAPAVPDDSKRLNAPSLILDTLPAAGLAPAAASTATATPEKPGAGNLSTDEAFADRVGNSSAETASAVPLRNPSTTVVQGTMIPAVLETAINSDLPGYARAIVSQDVRAFDGSRVLIPRASHLVGQYKSGIADGQRRAYVLWSRLIRPDGASVPLASPSTDFSGQTGIAGDVDTHFFSRFGSALLLSVVDLFSSIGSAGSVVISGGTSAASVAAQKDSQIPPTVTVPIGTPVRIFAARDLDFAAVAHTQP